MRQHTYINPSSKIWPTAPSTIQRSSQGYSQIPRKPGHNDQFYVQMNLDNYGGCCKMLLSLKFCHIVRT